MSDRSLKILTTLLLLLGVALMLAWPMLFRSPGPHLTLSEKRAFLVRYLVYIAAVLADFVATSVCAYILVRRARARYADLAEGNLKRMIEGAIDDQQRSRRP